MSERSEHHYDSNTPEDRLIKFKFLLKGNDARAGAERAGALYTAAIVRLTDLLDAHGVADRHQGNIVLGGLITSHYELDAGMAFDDWLTRLRLIPLRLVEKEIPELESYTPQYICELFDTALPQGTTHNRECLGFEYENDGCDHSPVCPARIASRIGLRQLGLLLFDRATYDPTTELKAIQRTDKNIRALSHYLVDYGFFEKEDLEEIADEVEKITNDLHETLFRPKHRRPD